MKNIPIATTRFNTDTWSQNQEFRIKNNLKGCVYGAPRQISPRVSLNSLLFVIEMNNSTNKVEGISLIKNFIQVDKQYPIYQAKNYNRYIYKSEYRICRDVVESYNSQIIHNLDHILFKEKTHLKRGSGFTLIPNKLLNHSICRDVNMVEELRGLFQHVYLERIE